MIRTLIGRLLIAAVIIGGFAFIVNNGRGVGEARGVPRMVEFKELVLDGQSLARSQAYIAVEGVYSGLSADLELLYPPTHTPLNMGDDGIRIMTTESSRDVREMLYGCRQREAGNFEVAACRIQAVGWMNTCYLKIATSAEFPCLQIERISIVESH